MIIKCESKTYFEITIPDETTNESIVDILGKMQLSIGADNYDNESVFYPSNIKIEFHTKTNLIHKLFNSEISINVFEDNNLVFVGYLDIEDINFEPHKNIYKLAFYDNSKLKEMEYAEGSSFLYTNSIRTIPVLINGILSSIGRTVETKYPTIITGITEDILQDNSNYIATWDRFGTFSLNFFDGKYQTLWDCLKAILDSLGLISYFSANKLYVTPGFFFHEIINIESSDYDISKTEISLVGGYDYVEILYRNDYYPDGIGIVFDHRKVPQKDPLKKITYNLGFPEVQDPSSNNPGDTVFDLYALGFDNLTWHDFLPNAISINGELPEEYYLAVGKAIDQLIGKTRRKIKTTIFKTDLALFDNIQIDGVKYKIINIKKDLGTPKITVTGLEI